jgi:hypothetical protein
MVGGMGRLTQLLQSTAHTSYMEWEALNKRAVPTTADREGAMDAVLRLHRTYKGNVTTLMPLVTASVYLQIGQRAYQQGDWLAAIDWLEAAQHAASIQAGATGNGAGNNGDGGDASADDMFNEESSDGVGVGVGADSAQGTTAPPAATLPEGEPLLVIVLDHLAFAHYKAGNLAMAIGSTNALLDELVHAWLDSDIELGPTRQRAQANLEYYTWLKVRADGATNAATEHRSAATTAKGVHEQAPVDNLLNHSAAVTKAVASLCRGDPTSFVPLNAATAAKRYLPTTTSASVSPGRATGKIVQPACVRRSYNNPWLQYQPFAVERIPAAATAAVATVAAAAAARVDKESRGWGDNNHPGIRPQGVTIFRDFLTDAETQHLLDEAKPRIARSVAYIDSGYKPVEFRTSQVAWLENNTTDTIVQRINSRIGLATRLNLKHAEQLQVNNYGLGGHYEPHYDATTRADATTNGTAGGNRLATFMIYLSNVAAGGNTAFPYLGLGVTPRKNDAIFWFNLEHTGSGEINGRTLHSGCPVLEGHKWVANKWIHEDTNQCFGDA